MTETRLSLSVCSNDPEVIARACEHFSRTAVGLALDGVQALIVAGPEETDA